MSDQAVEISACCQESCAIKNAVCFPVAKLKVLVSYITQKATMMRELLVYVV